MKQLPENVVAYQHTLEFTNSTMPDGLFRAHSTKAGVWGLIVLLEGSLMYRILEPNHEEIRLSVERFGKLASWDASADVSANQAQSGGPTTLAR